MSLEFERACWISRGNRDQEFLQKLWTRAAEHASKLALIYACTQDSSPAESVIDEHAYEWGMAVAQHSVLTIEEGMKGNVFETDHARLVARLIKLLTRNQGSMPIRDIYRSMTINKRDADLLIDSAHASGHIKKMRVESPTSNKSQAGVIIVLQDL